MKKLLKIFMVFGLFLCGGCSGDKTTTDSTGDKQVKSEVDVALFTEADSVSEIKQAYETAAAAERDIDDLAELFVDDLIHEDYESMLTYISRPNGYSFATAEDVEKYIKYGDDNTNVDVDMPAELEDFIGISDTVKLKDIDIDTEVGAGMYATVTFKTSYKDENDNEVNLSGYAKFKEVNDNYYLDVDGMYGRTRTIYVPSGSELYFNGIQMDIDSTVSNRSDKYTVTGLVAFQDYEVVAKLTVGDKEYSSSAMLKEMTETTDGESRLRIAVDEETRDKLAADYQTLWQNMVDDIHNGITFDQFREKYMYKDVTEAEAKNIYNGFKEAMYMHQNNLSYKNVTMTRVVPYYKATSENPAVCVMNSEGVFKAIFGVQVKWNYISSTSKDMTMVADGYYLVYEDNTLKVASAMTDRMYYFNEYTDDAIE